MKVIPMFRAILTVTLAATLSGCAALSDLIEPSCDAQNAAARGKPKTLYTLESEQGTAPKGVLAQAPVYKLRFRRSYVHPCGTLIVLKEATILRGAGHQIVFTEVRDFFAEDGTLIASVTDDQSASITKSGVYTSRTEIAIPQNAPPGKYRISTRLLAAKRGGPAVTLGQTSGYFFIVPRD